MMTNIINASISFLILVGSWSLAGEPSNTYNEASPCAVLKEFGGEVQILDAARNVLIDTKTNAGVPCGGWVSVRTGWAKLKHRQGYLLRLGSETFVELFDNEYDRHLTGEDQVVLYKGRVYFIAPTGSAELRVATTNARARMTTGVGLMIYSQYTQESQFIALERKGTLENRFEPNRVIAVKSGEGSRLDFRNLRVVPSTPAAINVAQMREQLHTLPLTETEHKVAIQRVAKRRLRRMPSLLVLAEKSAYKKKKKEQQEEKTEREPSRGLASGPISGPGPFGEQHQAIDPEQTKMMKDYERHPTTAKDTKSDRKAEKLMEQRLAGGEMKQERLLYPGGKPKKKDLAQRSPAGEKMSPTEREKQREAELEQVLEDLSRIPRLLDD